MKRLLVIPLLCGIAFAQSNTRLTATLHEAAGESGAPEIFNPAQSMGQAWHDVTAYGAKCDAATDDTTPIQAAVDAALAAGGGLIYFPPGKTCVVAGTIKEAAIHDVTFLGYGTKLYGTSKTGPIMELGDATGATFSQFVRVLGLTLTNGAWQNGAYKMGQSRQDGIILRGMRQVYVDVMAVNLGGRAVVVAGAGGSSAFEWATVRVNAYDVGTPLYAFRANNVEFVVNSRRAHVNSAYLWDGAGIDLSILADETLQPPSPGVTDGAGVVLRSINWTTIHGTVVGAKLEAVKMIGNTNWNQVAGAFCDSSTLRSGGTSSIVLAAEGGASPEHNTFKVFAGYTGRGGTPNKPAYGIRQISGADNIAIGLDAAGVQMSPAAGGIQVQGGSATHLSASINNAAWDLSAPGVTCAVQKVAVPGAVPNSGDTVSVNVDPSVMSTRSDIIATAWISAADTVDVRLCDAAGSNPPPFTNRSLRVAVWNH